MSTSSLRFGTLLAVISVNRFPMPFPVLFNVVHKSGSPSFSDSVRWNVLSSHLGITSSAYLVCCCRAQLYILSVEFFSSNISV